MEMDTPNPRDRPIPALNDTQSSQSACNRCVQMNIWDTCDASPTNSCTNCVRAHLGQRCRRCVRPQTERLEKKRKREGDTEPEGGSIQSPRAIPTLDEAMLEQQQQPVRQSNKQRKRTQRQLNNVREREKVWQAAQSNMTPYSTLSIPRMPELGPNAYEQPTFSQQPSMNAYATPFMPGLATTLTPGFAMDSDFQSHGYPEPGNVRGGYRSGNDMASGGIGKRETRKERIDREFESLRTRTSRVHSEEPKARSPVREDVAKESRIERLNRELAELAKGAGC